MGGLYGPSDSVEPPFVAGHDGVAVVVKVGRACHAPQLGCGQKHAGRRSAGTRSFLSGHTGYYGRLLTVDASGCLTACVPVCPQVGPGVKGLAENDWVVPLKPNLGTWRSLAGARLGWLLGQGCERAWAGAQRFCWLLLSRISWMVHGCSTTRDSAAGTIRHD